MSQKGCNWLGTMLDTVGFTNSLISICVISSLAFCDTSINQFFYDTTALLALSCVHAFSTEMEIFVLAGLTILNSLLQSLSPILSLPQPSWRSILHQAERKPFPPVCPTSWVWLSSMGPWFSHICSLITHHPWPKHRWHLYSYHCHSNAESTHL